MPLSQYRVLIGQGLSGHMSTLMHAVGHMTFSAKPPWQGLTGLRGHILALTKK